MSVFRKNLVKKEISNINNKENKKLSSFNSDRNKKTKIFKDQSYSIRLIKSQSKIQ